MTDSNINNYFGIEECDNYVCKLSVYTSGYDLLYLDIWKSGDISSKFYVVFENVLYFSGVTQWKGGAYFRLGTVEETKEILTSLQKSDDYLDYNLFISDTSDAMVKIIARDAKIDTVGHPPIENEIS